MEVAAMASICGMDSSTGCETLPPSFSRYVSRSMSGVVCSAVLMISAFGCIADGGNTGDNRLGSNKSDSTFSLRGSNSLPTVPSPAELPQPPKTVLKPHKAAIRRNSLRSMEMLVLILFTVHQRNIERTSVAPPARKASKLCSTIKIASSGTVAK